MKKELLHDVPYGYMVLHALGGIIVDRDHPSTEPLFIKKERSAKANNVASCMYPEQTRVTSAKFPDADLRGVQPIKTGAVQYAIFTGKPIIPLGIAGLAEFDQPDVSRGVHIYSGRPLSFGCNPDIMEKTAKNKDQLDLGSTVLRKAIQDSFDKANQLRDQHGPRVAPGPRRKSV